MSEFGKLFMNVIDRAIAGKPSPIGTLAKEEAALRDCFEARHGVGAAAKLYQAALTKRLAMEEDHAADMLARAGGNKPLPSGIAASLARLKSEGIPVQQKLILLQDAMARPASSPVPASAPVPPASFTPPVASPAPAQPAPATPITDAYPLSSAYEQLEDPIDRQLFFREHRVQMASEDRKRARAEAAVKPSKVPTSSGDIIAQLASIGDSRARVAFYRANKAAIDASYEALNRNQ